ncbi:hypothetical protein S245_016095 [Arachis hypogaea]
MAVIRVHLLSASAIKLLRSSQGIFFINAFPDLIATPKPLRSRERTSSVNSPPPMTLVFTIGILSLVVFPTALGVNPMITVQAIAYCTTQSVLEVLRRKRR